MFSESGFIPIGEALAKWKIHFDPTIEKAMALDALAEKEMGAYWAELFARYEQREGLKLYWKNIEDFVGYELRDQARDVSLETFFRLIDYLKIFAFDGHRTLRCAPEILLRVHEPSFLEEFWHDDLNEIDEDTLDLETALEYSALPLFRDHILCFVDPFTWTIDLKGMQVIRKRVSKLIDPMKLRAKVDDYEANRDNNPEWKWSSSTFGRLQKLREELPVLSDERPTLSEEASDLQVDYILEYDFPLVKNIQLESIERLSGACLSLAEADWIEAFNEAKSVEPWRVLLKKDKLSIDAKREPSTAATEAKAFSRAADILTKQDWNGTLAELRNQLGFTIGARAWRRVVDRLRNDHPEISLPGRRPIKSSR